jgi:signal transduction histidine kinase
LAEQLLTRVDIRPPISAALEADLLALKPGSHLCLISEEDSHGPLATVLPFIRQGLDAGERCIYVADDETLGRLSCALDAYDVNVAYEVERRALLLWPPDQWPDPGSIDIDPSIERVRRIVEASLRDGFAAVRFVVEMACLVGQAIEIESLRRWEAALDSLFTPELPARIVCQYSRAGMSQSFVLTALHRHALAILGQDVCANAYYTPPETGPDGTPALQPVDWMIAQLRWGRAVEVEREQRVRAEAALKAEDADRRIQELYCVAEAAANDTLKAKAIKDEFVGLVSHELRTPITVILGNAAVLLKTMTFENDAYFDALQDIRSEAERLNRLVSNMLVLAKLDGTRQPELEPLLLGPIVTRMAAEHQRRHSSRRLNIQLLDAGTPCLANTVYVEQIIANLLSNAEKYSAVDKPVELSFSRDGDWLTLRVADRGIGLDAGDTAHLFEAFSGAASASNVGAGLGISLAACKRLVEAQDGRIWAKPREGGGAEFGFSFKVVEAPE